jgi:sugar phosphate isomerase/epimerase
VTIVPEIPAEIALPPPDQDRTWCDALEDLATIQGAFVGLRLLLMQQEEHLDTYALARVAMIIEVLSDRFKVLLDTALDGMLALRLQAVPCPSPTSQEQEDGHDD